MEPLSDEESEIRAKKSVCMSKHFGEQNVFAAFDRHLIIAHQFDAFKNTTTEKKRFRYQNDKHKNETNNDASSRSFVVEESN